MATIRIPTPLRKLTQGKEEVTATGATVGALIASLETQYPGIKERICDDSGQVRRFVNIFANDEDIRFLKNLETPVKDSDEISIVPAIAGGCAPLTKSPWWTSPATRARSRCPRSAPRARRASRRARVAVVGERSAPPRPPRLYLRAAGVGTVTSRRRGAARASGPTRRPGAISHRRRSGRALRLRRRRA